MVALYPVLPLPDLPQRLVDRVPDLVGHGDALADVLHARVVQHVLVLGDAVVEGDVVGFDVWESEASAGAREGERSDGPCPEER